MAECPHGIDTQTVKNFGCDECLNNAISECQGIVITRTSEGDLYSGCTASETGADDCPACGDLVRAISGGEGE